MHTTYCYSYTHALALTHKIVSLQRICLCHQHALTFTVQLYIDYYFEVNYKKQLSFSKLLLFEMNRIVDRAFSSDSSCSYFSANSTRNVVRFTFGVWNLHKQRLQLYLHSITFNM